MVVIDNIDKCIELTEKKVKLMKEYKQALLEERADYIVCPAGAVSLGIGHRSQHFFVLVDKSTGENLTADVKDKVLKFIEKKKLQNVHWRVSE